MGLLPLHEEIYYDFARRFFEANNGSLAQDVFHDIYGRLSGVTRSIQLVLNRLYETEKNVDSIAQVNDTILYIVNSSSMQYEGLTSFLTDNQLSLLKAIAKERQVLSPQSNVFIKQHGLSSASSVKTALDLLLDKELVEHTPTGYMVSDYFFGLWLNRHYF